MYSLVSSSLLTIDLVRHPNGVELSDVLSRTLRLTPSDMNALQAAFEDTPERRSAWAAVQAATDGAPRLLSVLASVRDALNEAAETATAPVLSGVGEQLSVTPMGNLIELLTMVERDILEWTRESHGDLVVQQYGHAVAAVRDAVAAAYARGSVDDAYCETLREPWLAVFGRLPGGADDDYGPQGAAVRRAIDLVAALPASEFERLNAAYWACYTPEVGWAPAMHAASWAAVMSGRLRPVAGAQLALMRAMMIAGLPRMLGASGVMMAGTAAMQATVLADLLDTATYETLTSAWVSTLGPLV